MKFDLKKMSSLNVIYKYINTKHDPFSRKQDNKIKINEYSIYTTIICFSLCGRNHGSLSKQMDDLIEARPFFEFTEWQNIRISKFGTTTYEDKVDKVILSWAVSFCCCCCCCKYLIDIANICSLLCAKKKKKKRVCS